MMWANCINNMDGLYIYYVPDYFKISYIEIGFVRIDSGEETCTLYTHEGEVITETSIRPEGAESLIAEDMQMMFSQSSDLILQMDILELPESRPIYYHRLSRPTLIDPLPSFPESIQLKMIENHYFLIEVSDNDLTTLRPITAISDSSLEFWDLPARKIKSLDF